MLSKSIWIYSKSEWTTSKRSDVPDGDASWIDMSKSYGAANDPIGEFVTVTVTDNHSTAQRKGYIDVLSGGKTITVLITQDMGSGITYNLVNLGDNLTNLGFNLVNKW